MINFSDPTEEQLKKLTESQLLELLKHVDTWFLPQTEIKKREELIKERVNILRLTSLKFREYYNNGRFNDDIYILDIAKYLKPIKNKSLLDFIDGVDYSLSGQQEDIEISVKLKKPIFFVLAIFISTKSYQQFFINRTIGESDTIEMKITESSKETFKTREKIKEILKQKILFDPRQIAKLKIEYLIEQEKLIKEIHLQNKHQNNQPQQLKTNLSDTQRTVLFDLLVKGGFIPNENKDCFIWVFGKLNVKQPEPFKAVKWMKTNTLTKGKIISKRSLLNLLSVLKVKESQIIDKQLLNCLFAKPDGKSIKVTSSNYQLKGYISEYDRQLIEIVNRLQ